MQPGPPADDHESWSELAAGHVLSALDDVDEASYLEHVAQCRSCRELERELTEVFADLALAAPPATPPPSLKASIMQAVVKDDEQHTAPVVSIGKRHSVIDITEAPKANGPAVRSRRTRSALLAAAAVLVVLVTAGLISWRMVSGQQASVAARCADAHCPTVVLRADGRQVGVVMILERTAYVRADGLPGTPQGRSYVLWRISGGQPPVGLAAVNIQPGHGPVKAGSFTVPIGDVTAFALSSEPGDAVPAAPTKVIAQGSPT
jgi:anti-sigma-K factor RskA